MWYEQNTIISKYNYDNFYIHKNYVGYLPTNTCIVFNSF